MEPYRRRTGKSGRKCLELPFRTRWDVGSAKDQRRGIGIAIVVAAWGNYFLGYRAALGMNDGYFGVSGFLLVTIMGFVKFSFIRLVCYHVMYACLGSMNERI